MKIIVKCACVLREDTKKELLTELEEMAKRGTVILDPQLYDPLIVLEDGETIAPTSAPSLVEKAIKQFQNGAICLQDVINCAINEALNKKSHTERLTRRYEDDGTAYIIALADVMGEVYNGLGSGDEERALYDAIQKLADYEDAEEVKSCL